MRLDRALASVAWQAHFPLADLTHLVAATSDHSPILVNLNREQRHNQRQSTFKYEVMWEGHESWSSKIAETWANNGAANRLEELRAKLSAVSQDLERWNKDTFGSVRKEIKQLKGELEKLRSDASRTAPTHVELKINEKLVELYHREEVMWRQRSRVQWLSSGDRNTKFFHLRASIRRKKNMIKALQNSLGVITYDPDELKVMVNDFYKNLYTTEGVSNMEAVLNCIPRKVTPEMNEVLCAHYTNEEVKAALFQMFPTKAPGPDGFPAHFFQRHWDLCGEEIRV